MARKSAAPPWMMFGFPAVATVIAFIAAHWRVLAGASPALYVLVPLVAAATYLALRRVMTEPKPSSTVHQYTVYVSGGASPALGELLERLSKLGYEPDARSLDEVGNLGPRPGHALELRGAQIRITDKRADEELGNLAIRLRAEAGAMIGLIEATDTGPGIYDEMAQFAIVALADLCPGLEYLAVWQSPDRKPALGLRDSLPDTPLGLALL